MAEFDFLGTMFDFLLMVVPVLLPFGILAVLIDLYIDANKRAFLASQEHVLLEIMPPQDITKSPAAMELFLVALYQTSGETTWYDRLVKGQVRPWFSLELVSIEGNVRFFIWTREKVARLIESQLYSQFPGIEVTPAEDYTIGFEYNDNTEMFGLEYTLTQPDPYPIKTYVDYGLDKEQEEEFKIDPITPTLEFLGGLGRGEYGWIQIILRAHKKEDKDPTKWFGVRDNWKETAKAEVAKIRKEGLLDAGKDAKQVNVTKGQSVRIEALERSVSKLAFDTGIRSIYITEKSAFQGGNIGAMVGSFKQYGSLELNGFRPAWTTSFDYPWQDPSGKRVKILKEEILEAYKERAYFFRSKPQFHWWRPMSTEDRSYFVLNTEEVATIYHFPGQVSQTPSMQRVSSKKATPPANLPV
jgi:hypothetical protein